MCRSCAEPGAARDGIGCLPAEHLARTPPVLLRKRKLSTFAASTAGSNAVDTRRMFRNAVFAEARKLSFMPLALDEKTREYGHGLTMIRIGLTIIRWFAIATMAVVAYFLAG